MVPRLAQGFLLFSLIILTGCPLSAGLGFLGFVVSEKKYQQRGRKPGQVLEVKLRNTKSGEATWCQDNWVTRLFWPGNEVENCKEFYVASGYEPVATLISQIGWIVYINRANAEDLVTVFPELDPADAQAIVNAQPYGQKSELVEKGILSSSTYELVKGKLILGNRVRDRADSSDVRPSSPTVSGRNEIEW